jgi:hypothetical protein
MYWSHHRVVGDGLVPSRQSAGGSNTVRVSPSEQFQRRLDAALDVAAAGVEPASPNELIEIYKLRAV